MMLWRGFICDPRGVIGLVLALALPVILGSVAAAVEYSRLAHRRVQLQKAADTGALTGGQMLTVASRDDGSLVSAVQSIVEAQARLEGATRHIEADVIEQRSGVRVRLEEDVPTLMGKLLSLPTATIVVGSEARITGTTRLCVLALEPQAKGAIHLEKQARISANSCSVYSNSRSPQGLVGKDGAVATALAFCSGGGVDDGRASFTPQPQTDCPAIPDPLADRPLPAPGACAFLPTGANPTGKKPPKSFIGSIVTGIVDLEPGTYCGGLMISDTARVTLRAGTYIFKDGPLIVDKNATLNGVDVALFFTGAKGGLLFDKKTTVSLAAPRTGLMAGLLIAEERAVSSPVPPEIDPLETPPTPPPAPGSKPAREYRIISDNARTMLGTIYLPAGRLVVDAKKPVSDQSAYTVIVAQQVNLYEGPNLVLNANYSATTVPVPKGVGPTSGDVRLTH